MDTLRTALFFSHVAYGAYGASSTSNDEDAWKEVQRSCGFDPTRIRAFECAKYDIGDTRFVYDIHEATDTLIVAFRGTKTWSDLVADITIYKDKLIDVCYTPYYLKHERPRSRDLPYVHQGFYEIFNLMKYEFLNVVNNYLYGESTEHRVSTKKRIVVTGHSLGGAISVIASAMLYAHYHHLVEDDLLWIENITFGAPKVGNAEFKRIYDDWMGRKMNHCIHYYHSSDPVPSVPFIQFYALSKAHCVNRTCESLLYGSQYHHLESYRDRILQAEEPEICLTEFQRKNGMS